LEYRIFREQRAVTKPWRVMKFGGTSVATAVHWDAITEQVRLALAEGRRPLVVVSALAGVTDQLLALEQGRIEWAVARDALEHQHRTLADALELEDRSWLEGGVTRLESALDAASGPRRRANMLAVGEAWSSRMGAAWFAQQGLDIPWIDACDALQVIPEPDPDTPRAWLSARCEAYAAPELAQAWAGRGDGLIAPGFVARAPDGGTALLGRSGSDTSAALLATRLSAEVVEIWTDVPGLFTADPRIEPEARPVETLAWEDALEMAAGGARVIHGRSIRAAASCGIDLLIRDLGQPEAPGTRITAAPDDPTEGARAIACQSDMLVLLLRNLDTRQQVGFLARVFGIFAERGISVDQVATSETTTTVAIDRVMNHLDDPAVDALVDTLASLCEVETYRDAVTVNVVGRDARLVLAELGDTKSYFARQRLLMMSHSAADRSVSFLVEAGRAEALARLLHRRLVLRRGAES
jgi:diaminopimelate decarboxylase/aspartate kinase